MRHFKKAMIPLLAAVSALVLLAGCGAGTGNEKGVVADKGKGDKIVVGAVN